MRRARAAAAAVALAAALLAAGCKPSSLTPFGIDERPPATDTGAGLWQGITPTGGTVEFSVANDEVLGLLLAHRTPACVWRLQSGDQTAVIDGDSFTLEVFYEPSGRLVFTGTFTSTDAAAGSYFFEGMPAAPPCLPSGSGDYVAGRVR